MPTEINSPIKPRWFCIFAKCGPWEAPPSRWHGVYGFSHNTHSTLYAIVPLNLLLAFACWIWHAIRFPSVFFRVYVRRDDEHRNRAIAMEHRCMLRACHEHRLVWDGNRFATYEEAASTRKNVIW